MVGSVVVVTGEVVVVVVADVVGVTGWVVKVGEPTSSRDDSDVGVVVNVPAACEWTRRSTAGTWTWAWAWAWDPGVVE